MFPGNVRAGGVLPYEKQQSPQYRTLIEGVKYFVVKIADNSIPALKNGRR